MPGIKHEAVIEVLQNEPHLITLLLRDFGVRIPSGATAAMADTNLSVRDPDLKKTLISDNVIILDGADGKIAVIAEVQSKRPDQSRARLARVRVRCPVPARLRRHRPGDRPYPERGPGQRADDPDRPSWLRPYTARHRARWRNS
jgi:hypothetical protein